MMQEQSDLPEIGRLSDEQVNAIHGALAPQSNHVLSPTQLLAIVDEALDDSDSRLAAAIVGNLLQLHQIARRAGEPVSDLINSRRDRIDGEVDQGYDKEGSLKGLEILEQFSALPVFVLAASAIDLAYDCDNLLQRSRILTDVRPIFSEDAGTIDGAIVAHTLRLRYDSGGQDRELSLAIDPIDLRQFIFQCERALLKEQTARQQLIEKAEIPTAPQVEVQSHEI